ncbi:MAG TPA: hypothetical protein VH417_05135 [Vicinamibacterales bacterium]
MPGRLSAIRRELAIAAAYLLLAAVATFPLAGHGGTAVPLGGDSWVNYWNLWWVKTALLDAHTNPFFTPDLHYPDGAYLYLHTLNFLPAVVVAPVTALFGVIPAFNLLVAASFVLSGYAAYRLALYVLRTRLASESSVVGASHVRAAAFVGGVAFAFSSYRFAHLRGHLDLLQTEWIPVFVLLLLRVKDHGRLRDVVLAGLALAGAFLTAAYYAVFLLMTTALAALDTVVSAGWRWSRATTRTLAIAAVFAVCAAPVLAPTLIRGRAEGRTPNPGYDADRFSADLLGFVIPSPLSTVWRGVTAPAYRHLTRANSELEIVTFLGVVPLVLTAVAFGSGGRTVRTFAWMAIVFSVLALGPIAHVWGAPLLPQFTRLMPYAWLARLPYGDIPRVPARFVVMASAALAVLSAIGALTIAGTSTRFFPLIAAGLVTAAIVDGAVAPLPLAEPQAPEYFRILGGRAGRGALLELPIPDDPAVYPERMFYQTVHRRPIFGGALSRGLPPLPFDALPGFSQLKNLEHTVDDVGEYDRSTLPDLSRAVLSAYGTTHVAVEKWLMEAGAVDKARRISEEMLGPAAYEDEKTLVFEVRGSGSFPAPAAWLDHGWSYRERTTDGGVPRQWHWMGPRARFGLGAPKATSVRLQLSARAFRRPRRVQLTIGGTAVDVLTVGAERADYETAPFRIPEGLSFLDVVSLDGAESPGADPRRLSLELSAVRLAER